MSGATPAKSRYEALADEQLLGLCLRGGRSQARRERIQLAAALLAGGAAVVASIYVDWPRVLRLEALGLLSVLTFAILTAAGFLVIAHVLNRESRARAAALRSVENLSPSEGKALLQTERSDARGAGCGTPLFGGIAIATLLVAANYFLPLPERARFTFPTAVVAFAAAFLGVWTILAAFGRDVSEPRSELELRYGSGSRGAYLRQARAALRADGAPDWIVLLTGTGLPHGARRWVRVELWTSPSLRMHAEVRTSPRWGWNENDAAGFARGEAEPGEEPGRGLQRLLEAGGIEDVKSDVIDGFPCTVTVLRREPATEATASCNLGGTPNPERPAVALAQALLKIGDEVPTPPLVARLTPTGANEERR